MRIIISPAKKMRVEGDTLPPEGLPAFLSRTEALLEHLRAMTPEELQALWQCSDRLAAENVERVRTMDLRRNLTPAVLAYEGIQYQYMAPGVMTGEVLSYLQAHLRILSGFYGVLRPFDGVTPYRLEMQAKLPVGKAKDLYAYWGRSLADALWAECDTVVDLASREYSVCVSRYVPEGKRLITCRFPERKGTKLAEKGTMCKMARGEMVRFLAEHQLETAEGLKGFDRLGYRFSPEDSTETTYVFVKEEA